MQSCCYDSLINLAAVFDHTVDDVLIDPRLVTKRASVTGDGAQERTGSGPHLPITAWSAPSGVRQSSIETVSQPAVCQSPLAASVCSWTLTLSRSSDLRDPSVKP